MCHFNLERFSSRLSAGTKLGERLTEVRWENGREGEEWGWGTGRCDGDDGDGGGGDCGGISGNGCCADGGGGSTL